MFEKIRMYCNFGQFTNENIQDLCNKYDCVCTNILQVSFESTKVTVTEEIPLLPGEKVQGIGTD